MPNLVECVHSWHMVDGPSIRTYGGTVGTPLPLGPVAERSKRGSVSALFCFENVIFQQQYLFMSDFLDFVMENTYFPREVTLF